MRLNYSLIVFDISLTHYIFNVAIYVSHKRSLALFGVDALCLANKGIPAIDYAC